MQGRGKDAADPDGAISGVAGIVEADGDAMAGKPAAVAMLRSHHPEGQGGGRTALTGDVPQGSTHDRDTAEPEVRLDEAAQALIGQHLKAVYSEIVQQPIPDEFLKLLDDLERKERS